MTQLDHTWLSVFDVLGTDDELRAGLVTIACRAGVSEEVIAFAESAEHRHKVVSIHRMAS